MTAHDCRKCRQPCACTFTGTHKDGACTLCDTCVGQMVDDESLKRSMFEVSGANLKGLVLQGCEAFYREIFGNEFWDSLAPHHKEALGWHFESRIALCQGKRPPNEWFAYFPIWARGNNKTTLAEILVVVDAMISLAYNVPGFCLYIGREKNKIKENIGTIKDWLYHPQVKKYAPQLSEIQVIKDTNEQGRWTADLLQTNANYVIKGVTVESANAGSKFKKTRVTLFVPDDIDDRFDSPVISETRYRLLTSEILPMRQANTLTFFAQNLISRFSVMYRMQKGQSRALANRKPTEPIPAVKNLVTEQRTIDGRIRDVYVAGEPTWQVWNGQRIQDEIDAMTLPVFLTECQHEVEQSKEGQILYNYDDSVHVISESEFKAKVGDSWKQWRKKPGNDWARTKTDKHANVAGWLMRSPQYSELPNITFFMPYSFPADSAPEDVAERLLSTLSPYAYETKDGKVSWAELRKELLRRANADLHTKTVGDKLAFERGELGRTIPKYTRPLLQRCNVQQGEMSHEADTVRKIYSQVYGLGLKGVNPGKHGGIENIINALRVDYESDHPFRPEQKGYTQWFMIAPDDLTRSHELDGKIVYYPKPYPEAMMTNELVDSDLARFQMQNYRHRDPILTASGEVIDEPLKLFDDICNMLMMMYVGNPLTGDSLTIEQQVKILLPEGIEEALVEAKTGTDKLTAMLDLEFQRDIIMERLVPQSERDAEWE